MKKIQLLLLSFLLPAALLAADTNPPPRLTVELRDGSRVVGTSVEKNFKFHSALLGDLHLDLGEIRSIESAATNSVKLSTVNGDALTVTFVDSDFAVETSFGKVKLAVASVRKLSVAAGHAPGAHPPGLVALWSGEGDGNDSVGGNTATLTDISFVDGKVGQAFSLNGSSSCMKIPANPSLDVGTGDGLTITVWIKPSDVNGNRPILEWNPNVTDTIGVDLWLGDRPDDQGVFAVGIKEATGGFHSLRSPPGTLVSGVFQQVALTYDRAGGVGTLYLNGANVMQSQVGNVIPLTKGDIWVGHRPNWWPGSWTYNKFFDGLMDEIAIYNRALSAAEVRADFEAGNSK